MYIISKRKVYIFIILKQESPLVFRNVHY